MRIATLLARLVLGGIFLVFAINHWANFLPRPEWPPEAEQFYGALVGSGYLMTVEKVFELAGSLMVLTGWYLPLGLTLLAPLIVNIFFFHLVLAPVALPLPLLLIALAVFLAWRYRAYFRGVLTPRAVPA